MALNEKQRCGDCGLLYYGDDAAGCTCPHNPALRSNPAVIELALGLESLETEATLP